MDAFWLRRGFLAYPGKVKQDFSDSIFIKAEIVPGLAFPEQEVIITLLSRYIRRTQVTCRHYWSVGETHISPSERIGFP
jgi:hypothetical protein